MAENEIQQKQFLMDVEGSIDESTNLLAELVEGGLVTELRPIAPCSHADFQRCPVRVAAQHVCVDAHSLVAPTERLP